MKSFCFHTHSNFCDGKASVEDVCKKAVEMGLEAVGFSSHAPVPFSTAWAMPFSEMNAYVTEVERCKAVFKGQLEVYRALEADFIGVGKSIPFAELRKLGQLDYIIGSVHLVRNPEKDGELWFLDGPSENYDKGIERCFGGDAQMAVEQYYTQIQEMVLTQQPEVIAHMDKVVMNNKRGYFSESDTWYQDILEKTLQVIAACNTIIEVNTRGIYRGKYPTWFPNQKVIKRCVELNIPLTVSVDAHHPDELKFGFDDALQAIKDVGGKMISVFQGDRWKQIDINDVVSDK